MSKWRLRLGDDEYIYGAQAGKILGIHRSTFHRRFKYRQYPEMKVIKTRVGLKYCLRDVISATYPEATNRQLDELVIRYRESGFYRIQRKKKRRKISGR